MAQPVRQSKPGKVPPNTDKVVVHLEGGRLYKGTLTSFDPTAKTVQIQLYDGPDVMEISIQEVKAIFYVKSFVGRQEYIEKRIFGISKSKGKRIMVRFKDGEIICGFSEEKLGLPSNTMLLPKDPKQKGFFVYPADPKSNNTKVFVVTDSLLNVQRL